MVLRIREKLARMRAAAAEAPAPAPAQKPSPFRNKKRDRTEVELPNVSPSAAAEFRRPSRAQRDATTQRNEQTKAAFYVGARLDDRKIPGFQCRPLTTASWAIGKWPSYTTSEVS